MNDDHTEYGDLFRSMLSQSMQKALEILKQTKEYEMSSNSEILEFKIGMIAPSRAGKTTLLNAIYHETSNMLIGKGISMKPSDKPTQTTINEVLTTIENNLASNVWEAPTVGGTGEVHWYKFAITIGTGSSMQKARVSILDYPGGYLGMEDFDAEIAAYLNQCSVMLVPVSSDYLMLWKNTLGKTDKISREKNKLASQALQKKDVSDAIKEWQSFRKDATDDSVLIFVPVKCEIYFNDNGGHYDESKALLDTVEEYYRLDELAKEPKIHVEIRAVDTYGIVEQKDEDMDLYTDDEGKKHLKSEFCRRHALGNEIKTLGAFNILASVLDFHMNMHFLANALGMDEKQLKENLEKANSNLRDLIYKIENRWFKWFYEWFPSLDKDKAKAERLQRNTFVLSKILELKKMQLNLPSRYRCIRSDNQ